MDSFKEFLGEKIKAAKYKKPRIKRGHSGLINTVVKKGNNAFKHVFRAIGKRLHGTKLTPMSEPEKLHRMKGQDINKFEREGLPHKATVAEEEG